MYILYLYSSLPCSVPRYELCAIVFDASCHLCRCFLGWLYTGPSLASNNLHHKDMCGPVLCGEIQEQLPNYVEWWLMLGPSFWCAPLQQQQLHQQGVHGHPPTIPLPHPGGPPPQLPPMGSSLLTLTNLSAQPSHLPIKDEMKGIDFLAWLANETLCLVVLSSFDMFSLFFCMCWHHRWNGKFIWVYVMFDSVGLWDSHWFLCHWSLSTPFYLIVWVFMRGGGGKRMLDVERIPPSPRPLSPFLTHNLFIFHCQWFTFWSLFSSELFVSTWFDVAW